MNMLLFSGNGNPVLGHRVAGRLGMESGKIEVSRFRDGEIKVQLCENVRGMDVFILQSICHPVNDNLMELLLMADAMRRSSAQKITAVVPYLGYARQDRRPRSARVPISAKLIADMLMAAGINHVLTVDLHTEQLQGYFHCPVDNIYTTPLMAEDASVRTVESPPMIVSPDVGGVVRARALAKQLGSADLAIIDKRRHHHDYSEVMNVIGDVEGRVTVIVDDIVDTAGTLCQAAAALKDQGAVRVFAYVTHRVLSGKAFDTINASVLDELVTIDTIPLDEKFLRPSSRIRELSIDAMLAEAIRRVNSGESVSAMFPEHDGPAEVTRE